MSAYQIDIAKLDNCTDANELGRTTIAIIGSEVYLIVLVNFFQEMLEAAGVSRTGAETVKANLLSDISEKGNEYNISYECKFENLFDLFGPAKLVFCKHKPAEEA